MRGERWLLRVGDFLVGLAAWHLPAAARDKRRQEWAAELPVILGDPEVKLAAARAARMLWFAADTLRGTAVGPGRAHRHRGSHRSPADNFARWLAAGVALLTVMAASLVGLAFMVYEQVVASESLPYYATFFVSSLLSFAVAVLAKSRGNAWYWSSAGVVPAATVQFVNALAGRLDWGHPLLFTIISYCGYAGFAVGEGIAVALLVRSALRSRRSRSSA